MMAKSSKGSVSHWIEQLKAGDSAAAERLWGRYFQQLVTLARTRLHGTPRGAADEEDVALAAFDSFCRGAEHGRFPELVDRDSLWRLLVTITLRKAQNVRRSERRLKRGDGQVLGEAEWLDVADSTAAEAGLDQLVGREPSPEIAAQVAEECRRLLARLDEAALQAVALMKMEGYTNAEIAARSGCGVRTVERKLRLIRQIWQKELAP
jgi:DNA-directed RNA polymerase specialized sigma24 family protein